MYRSRDGNPPPPLNRSGHAALRHPALTSGDHAKPHERMFALAACRTRASPLDTPTRLSVRSTTASGGFPSVRSLPSTPSAARARALFGGLTGTAMRSDFPWSSIIVVRRPTSRCGLGVPGVLDRAGFEISRVGEALDVAFRSFRQRRHPGSEEVFAAQNPTRTCPCQRFAAALEGALLSRSAHASGLGDRDTYLSTAVVRKLPRTELRPDRVEWLVVRAYLGATWAARASPSPK